MPWIAGALENSRRYEAIAALLSNQNCSDLLPMLLEMLLPAAASYLKAKGKASEALRKIHVASDLLGQGNWHSSMFDKARDQLQTYSPHGAAKAQTAISNILELLSKHVSQTGPNQVSTHAIANVLLSGANVKALEAVVLYCHAQCEDAQDRCAFERMALQAYTGSMCTDTNSRLLRAYHGLFPAPNAFVSNNQVAATRRGGPRPRRTRHPTHVTV